MALAVCPKCNAMTQGGFHECPAVNSESVNSAVNSHPVNTATVNIRPVDAHSLLIARLAAQGVSLLDLEALARGEKKLVDAQPKPKTDRKGYHRQKMREHRAKLKQNGVDSAA